METKKQYRPDSCKQLSGNRTCNAMKTSCSYLERQAKQRCSLSVHLEWLDKPSPGKPKAEAIRQNLRPEIIKAWVAHRKEGELAGRKSMTGRALEDGLFRAIKDELVGLGCDFNQRKRPREGNELLRVNVDCLLEKKGYPQTIISIKTGLNREALRETFAYAYLFKQWLGQKGCRAFLVALGDDGDLSTLVDAFKPYLDGVYYLTKEPYIDDLLERLQGIYGRAL